ncbi:MAG: hypothetical protein ACLP01_03480 [Solirubrobacteraceae bacterium]
MVTVAVSPTIKLKATISAPVASIKPTVSRGFLSSMPLSPMKPIGQTTIRLRARYAAIRRRSSDSAQSCPSTTIALVQHPLGRETAAAVEGARQIATVIRQRVIEQSKRAHVGHIGSSLWIADRLGALFAGPLRCAEPGDRDRDRFIRFKGHAALAL